MDYETAFEFSVQHLRWAKHHRAVGKTGPCLEQLEQARTYVEDMIATASAEIDAEQLQGDSGLAKAVRNREGGWSLLVRVDANWHELGNVATPGEVAQLAARNGYVIDSEGRPLPGETKTGSTLARYLKIFRTRKEVAHG